MSNCELKPKRSISFKATHVAQIIKGEKTATRRPYSVPVRYQVGCQLWVREPHVIIDGSVIYQSDNLDNHSVRWRRPRKMPQWASRLTLMVKVVRVHHLLDITEDDARAEGYGSDELMIDPVQQMLIAWDAIYAHRKSMHAQNNPRVIAIEFDPIIIHHQ